MLVCAFLPVIFLMTLNCKKESDGSRKTSATSAPSTTVRSGRGSPTRPLIGLTSVYQKPDRGGRATIRVNFDYVQSVVEAGGVPVILPVNGDRSTLKRYVGLLDGLVLVGGRDIPPSAYGEKPLPQVRSMPATRYEFERELISLWLDSDKPLLGICLGAQFANVVVGGTLIQDIPTQVGAKVVHRSRDIWTRHVIVIEPDSRLRKILDAERVVVNSGHHQAVKDPGKGLKVVARSLDGVIEALEATDERFCLLVQWHPERMSDPEHRKAIFGAMIKACKNSNRLATPSGLRQAPP